MYAGKFGLLFVGSFNIDSASRLTCNLKSLQTDQQHEKGRAKDIQPRPRLCHATVCFVFYRLQQRIVLSRGGFFSSRAACLFVFPSGFPQTILKIVRTSEVRDSFAEKEHMNYLTVGFPLLAATQREEFSPVTRCVMYLLTCPPVPF